LNVLERKREMAEAPECSHVSLRVSSHLSGDLENCRRKREFVPSVFDHILHLLRACVSSFTFQIKLPSVTSFILDTEAVAWDREKKQIQPFQVLTTRKRKVASALSATFHGPTLSFSLHY
jgi:hypothetical protein